MDGIRTTEPLGSRFLLRQLRTRYAAGERWYFTGGRTGSRDDRGNYIPITVRIRQVEAINAVEEDAYIAYLGLFMVPEAPICSGDVCRQN